MNEQPILLMENITKVYSNGFVANQDVFFSLKKGEIHALAGENGAGKSTLMKILFGEEVPDYGRILLNNEEVKIDNPMTAIRYGIGMVHQHFMLAPSLTVAENMIMGMEPKRLGLIDSEKAVKMCREVAENTISQLILWQRWGVCL
ncbi:MAG: ATP-binding cassette domain-containing protein [[Clostridium] nexile]